MGEFAKALSDVAAGYAAIAAAFLHLSETLKTDTKQVEPLPTQEDPELLRIQIKELIRSNVRQYEKKIKALLSAFGVEVPSDIPINRLKEFKERLQGIVGGQ